MNRCVDGARSSVAGSSQAGRKAALQLSTLQAQKTLALFTTSALISPEQVCVHAGVCVWPSMDLSDLFFSTCLCIVDF